MSSSPPLAAVAPPPKKVTLKSGDGEEFVVETKVAMQSQTLASMIEDGCAADSIPVPNVTARILAKVIEFCKKHAETPTETEYGDLIVDEELRTWESKFVRVDQNTLFDLILAANYLEIKALLNRTCREVANMMKGKSVEEIRELFHIVNDYTPEEEMEVQLESSWAFE